MITIAESEQPWSLQKRLSADFSDSKICRLVKSGDLITKGEMKSVIAAATSIATQ
jgi:hypothetical protein